MKRTKLLITLIVTVLALSSCGAARKGNPLIGSWKLYGMANEKQLKHFTKTHFSWHWANRNFTDTSGATGTYKVLSDNTFFEKIEMGSGGMTKYIGTIAYLEYEIEQDTLIVSGKLATGFSYREKWVREK